MTWINFINNVEQKKIDMKFKHRHQEEFREAVNVLFLILGTGCIDVFSENSSSLTLMTCK